MLIRTATHFVAAIIMGVAAMNASMRAAAGTPTAADISADASADARQSPAALEEVVVTARQRQESLVDVPIAISVISGPELAYQGIRSVEDVYGRVPNLYVSNTDAEGPGSDFNYLVIRGIGFNSGLEPAVGVFIDGMYQPQVGYDLSFLNLERVEVLRGPQGTLFGRNTEGGALSLITQKPSERARGRFEFEASTFHTFREYGDVSGPLGENLYGALTAQHLHSDGYATNPLTRRPENPDDHLDVRGALRWVPSDALELFLAADRSTRQYKELGIGAPITCRCYDVTDDTYGQPDTKDNRGVQLNASWKITSGLTLTSISGYRRASTDVTFDYDGVSTDSTPAIVNGVPGSTVAPGPQIAQGFYQRTGVDQTFRSQEVRLDGGGHTWNWLAGGYAFKQNQEQPRSLVIGPGAVAAAPLSFLVPTMIREDFSTGRKGYAGFGQINWRPIDAFELSAGVRESYEKVSVAGERLRNIVQVENDAPTFFSLQGAKGFSDVTWSGSLTWHPTDRSSLYTTIAKGWKAGGFNRFPSTANAVLPYKSETSINYEIGFKGSGLDGKVGGSFALFDVEITALQLLTVTPDSAGIPVTTIANAGKGRTRGAELELHATPGRGWRFTLDGGFTDARYVDFLQVAADGTSVNRNGDRFETVPRVTAAASIEYERDLAVNWRLNASLEQRYVSNVLQPDISFLAPLGATLLVPSHARTNVRVALADAQWRFTVFVNNLFDRYDYNNVNYNFLQLRIPGFEFVDPMPSREVGLTISRSL